MSISFKTYSILSFLSITTLILYAYYTREQFYPTILFLVSSKISFVLSGNMVLVTAAMVAKLITSLFFGKLRGAEVEILIDKAKYSITETCLALTVFRHEINTPILLMFASLIYVKSFHWLGKSRMEYNEQIQPLPMKAHIRMFSLLFCLIIIDIGVSAYCIKRTINQGKSVFILFGFEFGLLVINIFILFFRYIIQSMDSYLETGLSSKGFALMLIDLIGDASKFVTYSFFFCLVFVYYGLPIHIIREVWISFLQFQSKLASFVKYLQLNHNLDKRFEDASPEELASSGECLICRETMSSGKKLPCGHIFHLNCLRGWLQHQQSCPLCRTDIPTTSLRPRYVPQQQQQQQQQQQPPQEQPPPPHQQPQQQQQQPPQAQPPDREQNLQEQPEQLSETPPAIDSQPQPQVRSIIPDELDILNTGLKSTSDEYISDSPEFPAFFTVKSSRGSEVYTSPALTALSIRSLRYNTVIFALERFRSDDGNLWLHVPDGWILEGRMEGLTFDAEVYVVKFQPPKPLLIDQSKANNDSKVISTRHRKFLPESTIKPKKYDAQKINTKTNFNNHNTNKSFYLDQDDEKIPVKPDSLLKKITLLEREMQSLNRNYEICKSALSFNQSLLSDIKKEYISIIEQNNKSLEINDERVSNENSDIFYLNELESKSDEILSDLKKASSTNSLSLEDKEDNFDTPLSQHYKNLTEISEVKIEGSHLSFCTNDNDDKESKSSTSIREAREKYFSKKGPDDSEE